MKHLQDKRIAAKDWQVDWDAMLPLLSVSITCNAYFSEMKKRFGTQVNEVLIINKDGKMVGHLETSDLESFSQELVNQVDTVEKATAWADSFKKEADKATQALESLTPEQFLNDLSYCESIFDEYGTWQVATKAVYNVLPSTFDARIAEALQEAPTVREVFTPLGSLKLMLGLIVSI